MCDFYAIPSTPSSQPRQSGLANMYDSQILTEDNFRNELQTYQSSLEIFDENENILNWWYARRSTYKRLSAAAKKILGMPASSTTPERSFSHGKHLITDQRTNLGADTVSGLMLGGFF